MDNLEKVEKIREKTGVSYEEAKAALEANNYDMLDAIVDLEKEGKIKNGQTASYTTGASREIIAVQEFEKAQGDYEEACRKKGPGELIRNFIKLLNALLKKSIEVKFCVDKDNKTVAEIPFLAIIIFVVCMFWVTVPLIIIGLFCGFSYHFTGLEKVVVDVNDVCDKASKTANDIKNDFMKEENKEN